MRTELCSALIAQSSALNTERETRFELATFALEGQHSTTELLPRLKLCVTSAEACEGFVTRPSALVPHHSRSRGERIRTSDFLVPNQARYRTALRPVMLKHSHCERAKV